MIITLLRLTSLDELISYVRLKIVIILFSLEPYDREIMNLCVSDLSSVLLDNNINRFGLRYFFRQNRPTKEYLLRSSRRGKGLLRDTGDAFRRLNITVTKISF